MDELRERIARWLCGEWMSDDAMWDLPNDNGFKDPYYRQADAILAAIQETHVIVERERFERLESVVLGVAKVPFELHQKLVREPLAGLQPGDLDPLP